MSVKKILTIERAKWRRGGHGRMKDGSTYLLNEKGLMCCLGFDALACGLTEDQIRGVGHPQWFRRDEVPDFYYKTRVCGRVGDAIAANDDPTLNAEEREHLVACALKKLGWDEVVFV